MGPLSALMTGLRRAIQYWPAWLLMFIATLAVAIPLALFPAASLLEAAHRPVIEDIAKGVESWQALDLLRLMDTSQIPADQRSLAAPQSLMNNIAYLGLLVLLLPVVGGIASAFIWGGVLLTYQEAPRPFNLLRFLWGCWHWFGTFLLLAVVQAAVFIATYLLWFVAIGALSQLGQIGLIIGVVLLLLDAGVWVAIFEVAGVQCVVRNTQNAFTGLGRGIRMVFSRFLTVAVFYALALLGLLLVHIVFRGLLIPQLNMAMLIPALIVQQGFILMRLFARAFRLAGLTALVDADYRGISGEAWSERDTLIPEPVIQPE